MASNRQGRRRISHLLAASAVAGSAFVVSSAATADDRSAAADVVERAPEETLHVERFSGRVPGGGRTLDHHMAVSGPDGDMDVDYIIELGVDLNPEQIELPRCGVLRLYDPERGGVPRWVSIEVLTAPSSTPHDTTADIGEHPGDKVLMLYPPDPTWTTGYMFVSFQCDGEIDVEYPVWVLVPLSEQAAVSPASADIEDAVDEEEVASAGSGCTAKPGRLPGATALLTAALAAIAIRRGQAARRRRAVR